MKLHRQKNKGFSLLEMLLSIAIITMLLGVGIPYFYDSFLREGQQVTSTSLVHYLQSARSRTLLHVYNPSAGDFWGVHVDDKAKLIVLFNGKDYSGRDIEFDEEFNYNSAITIDSSVGNNFDIVFAPGTGVLLSNQNIDIKIYHLQKTERITVNGFGVVTY